MTNAHAQVIYTTWDKFANFGGNFGIFAEITGVSFLGVLNLIFLCSARVLEICSSGVRKMIGDSHKQSPNITKVSPSPIAQEPVPVSPLIVVPKINHELKVEDLKSEVWSISMGSVYSMHSIIKIDEDVENN